MTPEQIRESFIEEIAHKRVEIAWYEAVIGRIHDSIGNYQPPDIRYDKCVLGEYECGVAIERLRKEIAALEVVLGLIEVDA